MGANNADHIIGLMRAVHESRALDSFGGFELLSQVDNTLPCTAIQKLHRAIIRWHITGLAALRLPSPQRVVCPRLWWF